MTFVFVWVISPFTITPCFKLKPSIERSAELGLVEEAYAAAQEVLRYDPEFSIMAHLERAPFKDPQHLDNYLAALRKAGLPE